MNIEALGPWKPLGTTPPASPALTPAGTGDFQQVFLEGLQSLNTQQIDVSETVKAFLGGEGPALHDVMLQAEEARLSLEFAVQMRNKMVEAYQEIMRMQL